MTVVNRAIPADFELAWKPDALTALQRIEAWFAGELLDRPPVRFTTHNAEYNRLTGLGNGRWMNLRDRWFDAEYQVEQFISEQEGQRFLGETFPVFCPNLGPGVFASFFGSELVFGEVTSWTQPCVHNWDDVERLQYRPQCATFQKIDELMHLALERNNGRYLVGYTDLHGSLDCVADWRHPEQLCLDLMDAPQQVHAMLALARQYFIPVYDGYDRLLQKHRLPSVNWMGLPVFGRLHIPSCDFSTMLSGDHFAEFYEPDMIAETEAMTHTIFHVDGRGVARHLDRILAARRIQAIQWVQGVGEDQPMLQWLPLIRHVRAAGKGIMVDLALDELEPFMEQVSPRGIFLCLSAPADVQPQILRRLERWAAGKRA